MDKIKAIQEIITQIASDTVIQRKDEELFGILFAEHLVMNGGPEINPDLLMLSLRDAFHELSFLKEYNQHANIESVFSEEYINNLIAKGWYQRKNNNENDDSEIY